ncbi:hypothetical protein [Nostoc sp. 'Lobaria pulmonaria (5183) cyanobiont']|nr:hypothetical protein [Nostoc sp. 'Lobaria pulmonaria (5183) cyanobiont']
MSQSGFEALKEMISRNLDKGKKGETTFHGEPSENVSPILRAASELGLEQHTVLKPNGETYKITLKRKNSEQT